MAELNEIEGEIVYYSNYLENPKILNNITINYNNLNDYYIYNIDNKNDDIFYNNYNKLSFNKLFLPKIYKLVKL